MLANIPKDVCCGCGVCVQLCPAHTKGMLRDREGFDYPDLAPADCTACGLCAACCPMQKGGPAADENCYLGVKSLAEERRARSSSGGFFPAVAAYVLRRGGVILGAAFDTGLVLKHQAARTMPELQKLAGSKYIQSSQEDTYRELKKALIAGKWVLYTGTPCQCEGIRRYAMNLGLPQEKLVLMDLVCYGVPSPGLWREYGSYLEREYGGKLTEYRFRDKDGAKHGQAVSYVVDGHRYTKPFSADLFCSLYFCGYSLRPACHHCPFTTVHRDTDFTAGDFWGIGHVKPDFDDGKGVSMVILHTKKAKQIWREISKEFAWFCCTEEDVCQKEQPRLKTPTAAASKRGLFYLLYAHLPFWAFVRLLWNGKSLRRFWR